MKYTKKLLSLVLVLVLALALAVPGFAATATPEVPADQGTGKITIGEVIEGKTYDIYRIFDLSYNAANKAYTYTLSSAWAGFLGYDGVSAYVTADEQGYISWVNENDDSETVAGLAALALKYAEAHDIAPVASVKADKSGAEFTGLKLGYYLVDSSTGALCSLNTTATEVIINEKNEVPVIDKEVKDTDDGAGAIVDYTITIDAKDGAEKYLVHDKMTNLELVGTPTVTYYATKANANEGTEGIELTAGDQYNDTTSNSDGCAFHIAFTDAYCATLKNGNTIVITYQARITEAAVEAGSAKNDVHLNYGSDGNVTHETVESKLHEFDVFKYADVEDKETPLAQAVFALKHNDTAVNLYAKGTEEVQVGDETVTVPVYYMCDNDSCDGTTAHTHVTQITTDATGRFIIKGLHDGNYTLSEVDAPDGYNQLNGDIAVTIAENGSVTYTYNKVTSDGPTVKVLNETGTVLPGTGGMGTTIFYTLGGVLVVGAAILLVTKKRVHDVEG